MDRWKEVLSDYVRGIVVFYTDEYCNTSSKIVHQPQ